MDVNEHVMETFLLHLQDTAEMMDRRGNYAQLNKLQENQSENVWQLCRKTCLQLQIEHAKGITVEIHQNALVGMPRWI